MRIACVILSLMTIIVLISCGGNQQSKENGKKLYATYCQGCHMEDGKGVPGMNAPLVGSSYVAGDKDKLVHIIVQGSAAFGNDPSRHYRNAMAATPGLTDEEIADILTYVRSSFGNSASEVTIGEVKSAKEKQN
ncbi:MAG: cytochrome c [Chitinophagaceae bacterium]